MPPTSISHYRVVRRLGAGGMGEVFLAEDTKLERSVALKLLPNELAADASRRKRFETEAKSASALNHSSICTIYEVGETDDGQPFIAMEYLEGQTLDTLARHRRLELREMVGIGVQVAEALEAARQHQVVHRDIKPGNIMVDAQGRVKVLDFGLAKRLDLPADASNVTQEGAIVGTPNYLSPELALGREVDSRTDIFSLGVVLYELAVGKNPFAGAGFGETVNNIFNRDPDPLKPWNPNVTAEFERVVFKCLEKDPAKRYATPAQLRDDLAKLQAALETPRSSGQKLRLATVVVTAAGLLVLIASWAFHRGQRSAAPRHIEALAVLPLQNRSGDSTQDYFADGMTDALTTELAQIGALRIIDHSSVLPFKSARVSRPEIIRRLEVDAVVEGAVFRVGERVRIDAKLIEAGTDRYLWAKSYERDLKDVLSLQRELAGAIASEIQVRLTPAQTARLAGARRVDPDAYELLLKARQKSAWTAVSITNVLALLEQSIRIDPGDPNAQAMLANCYANLPVSGLRPPSEVRPLAMAAAKRAIALDPELAEAHDTLGHLKWRFEWDFSGAERETQRAIELNPNSASAHLAYAYLLSITSRFDEAINQMLTLEKLKPGSEGALQQSGFIFYLAGRHDEAIGRFEKASSLGPDTAPRLALLAGCCLRKGQQAESISAAMKGRNLVAPGAEQMADAYLAEPFARAGRQEEVLQWVEAWERAAATRYVEPFLMALMTAPTGNRDKTFEWLERGCRERSVNMPFLKVHPILQDLRSEPRFTELLKKVGFDERSPRPTLATNATATAPRITSLAVKPLDDFSGDTNNAYLSDGMTEALCSALGNISALRVPGRASVMRYKGGQKSIQEMARELNVDAILEGSVQRNGNRIRVTAQLIEAATDRHLWSTIYNRDLSDFFVVQDEVAAAVAAEVQVRLTPEDQARLRRARPAKPETIEAYLLGMHHYWQWSDEGSTNALGYLQRAIANEPDYAPAHAGLALTYIQGSTWIGLWRPQEGVPKGKEAARKAIELDPAAVDAYVALAYARMNFDWDWAGAEKDFKRALELSPHSSSALDGYANFLIFQGRFDEAIAVWNKALETDLLSPALHYELGWAFYMSRQFTRSIPSFRKALELDRNFLWARQFLGLAYLSTGQTNQALGEFQTAQQSAPDSPWAQMGLGYFYGLTGRRAEAMQVLADLDQLSRKRYVSCVTRAFVYLGLGQKDSALEWLEKACKERDGNMTVLKVDIGVASLRSEPRFQAMLKKVGLDK